MKIISYFVVLLDCSCCSSVLLFFLIILILFPYVPNSLHPVEEGFTAKPSHTQTLSKYSWILVTVIMSLFFIPSQKQNRNRIAVEMPENS